MPHIQTVSELARSLRDVVEAEFPFVWVRGQITNLARPASGHIYFTLADGENVLPVVWFKSHHGRDMKTGRETIDPLTGEVVEQPPSKVATQLEDGQEILCAGRITVYGPRGTYQMVAELVEPQGAGDLQMAFEALKRELSARGYFDESRKRDLPSDPDRVAVITSAQGAAVRDFLRIASERGTSSEIRIYPSLVQGDNAPEQIVRAFDEVRKQGWAQAVALVRGGGSIEDLWAFNTEVVAKAVFEADIPVITGVGHEPDVTIADYVADVRAATPSHAAQSLWPRREHMAQKVDDLQSDLTRNMLRLVDNKTAGFDQLRQGLMWLSPINRLDRAQETLQRESANLLKSGNRMIEGIMSDLRTTTSVLNKSFGPIRMARKGRELAQVLRNLNNAGKNLVRTKSGELDPVLATLEGRDPKGPLKRGYSLVKLTRTGKYLRNAGEALPGDSLEIMPAHGQVQAEVTQVGNTEEE